MPMEIIACEQGTEDWYRARLGIPTASSFQCLLAKGAEQKGRATYMRQLAAERITNELTEGYSNSNMARGKEMEAEARKFYSLVHDADPEIVGFIRNSAKGSAPYWGCSPDSLIGADGMLEIKTKRGDLLIETILKDEFPNEHKAQCQGALWVAERDWIDLVVYWPKMPPFVKRVTRDVAYIATLARAVDDFNEELEDLVERIKRYGSPEARAA
jgi:YqaJ-like recombinase protein